MHFTSTLRETHLLKVGGSLLALPAFADALCDFVAERVAAGEDIVLVHGGGPQIEALHTCLGLESVKHGGLRATPPESMQAVAMALRGSANLSLVSRLVSRGVPALGLSGADLGLLRSDYLDEPRLGCVGGPPRVDVENLQALIQAGCVPVLAPVCLAPGGELLNVNADTVAHAVASALRVDSLDFVSDVPGVYDAEGSVRGRIPRSELRSLLDADHVRGGMLPKLSAALRALEGGVPRVRIGSISTLSGQNATELTP